MTVKQGLKRIIIKKTVLLICVATFLGILCILANPHQSLPGKYSNLIYTLASIGISLLILIFIAWKIRYFHNLFSKEFTGTVVDTKYERVGNYAITSIKNLNNFAVRVQLDNSNDIIELRFSMDKISEKVYVIGDRIHRIKGTRYPINLTREEAQHICPICGRDSCLEDECPDCRIKY
jgi:hypothetical protein